LLVLQVRSSFRLNAGAAGESRGEMLKAAESKLSYLKMVTPRRPQSQTGSQTYVYQAGSGGVAEGKARMVEKIALSQRDHSDSRARHESLMHRQYFGGRK
jgi:hypothetical protein